LIGRNRISTPYGSCLAYRIINLEMSPATWIGQPKTVEI
jgi:hypothetical protein